MNRPVYSIIIPLYNAESSIEACLKSVLSQDVCDKEIILVNDGSTDRTPVICEKYVKQYSCVKAIHQKNLGVSEARNRGIEEARGEWISFVDADDTVYPCYLSEFDKQENKADLSYFGSYFRSDDGCNATYYLPEIIFRGRSEIEKGILMLKQNTVNYGHYGYTWNKFFKASIIREHNIRFTPGIYFKEDEIFVNDYVQHINSLATLPYIGYDYRYTHNGLSWKAKTIDYWRLYYKKSEEFFLNISNEELKRHEYPIVMNACFKAIEKELDNRMYIDMLDEMLDMVRRFGYLYPIIGRKDYYSSIMDYYKDTSAKHRIDLLRLKKNLKSIFLK